MTKNLSLGISSQKERGSIELAEMRKGNAKKKNSYINEFGINHGPSENDYPVSASMGKETEHDRESHEKLMARRKEELYQLRLKVAKWEEKQAKFRKRQEKIKRNRI